MSEDTFVLHLNRPRCSMRVVKFRELTLPELDQVASDANDAVGKDATGMQYQKELHRQGIKAMLVAISSEPVAAGANVEELDKSGQITWEPVTATKLSHDMRWKYESLFRSKDEQLLGMAYNELHNVSLDDARDLVGKSMSSESKMSTPSKPTKQSAGTESPTSVGTRTNG